MSEPQPEVPISVACYTLFIGLVIGSIGGCLTGDFAARSGERGRASEANVGRYVADETTGDTTFVYGMKP